MPVPYEHKAFKLPEPDKHYCEECEYFRWGLRTAYRLEDGTCIRFKKPEHIYHRKESCPRYEPKGTSHKRDEATISVRGGPGDLPAEKGICTNCGA